MSHTAEIIAVGTEILLGNIANTDAQMLSQSLSTLGVNVFWHTVVGDNPQRLREALDIARHRADIILTTGGLGPTYDDLTKQTICAAFGQKLVLHEDILEDIRAFYQSALHVPMPENNTQQAELPEGCTVFDNPVGTAPGCAFEADGVHVLMLPGPPHECETMLRRCVEPYLRALSKEVIVSHDIMTFGMGESSVDQLLHDRMVRMVNPTLATYAKPCEVRLRATAKAAGAEEAEAMLAPVADAAQVTVETSLRSGCTLRCTEDDLYQICFNLMENAIKYNLPGGKVFVSVCRDGDQVLLEVADTGIGIPEEELPKVFNRFYRVDKARSRAAGGTGLGLSIVRDTVRRHGGWITAQRRQPEGSVFTAGFPCETPEVGGEPL